jgi:hypothetical protein
MTAEPIPTEDRDVFGLLPVAVAGLAQLERCQPLWGDRLEWVELVVALRAFEERWGDPARSAGWSLVQLYGLDPAAPRARLSRTGGAFLASLSAHQVIGVDTHRIHVVTRTAARMSIYKPEEGAVLAWSLRAAE